METKNNLIKLRDKLKKYSRQYYNSNPTINDSQYDDLKKKYDHLLLKNPELNLKRFQPCMKSMKESTDLKVN